MMRPDGGPLLFLVAARSISAAWQVGPGHASEAGSRSPPPSPAPLICPGPASRCCQGQVRWRSCGSARCRICRRNGEPRPGPHTPDPSRRGAATRRPSCRFGSRMRGVIKSAPEPTSRIGVKERHRVVADPGLPVSPWPARVHIEESTQQAKTRATLSVSRLRLNRQQEGRSTLPLSSVLSGISLAG